MAGYIGQLLMPDIAGSVMGGFKQGEEYGQQEKRRKTLAQYVQPALGGDQGALAKIYGVDPDAGMKMEQNAQQHAQQSKQFADEDLARLAKHARMVTALADSGDMQGAQSLYETIYPEAASKLGADLPKQLNPQILAHMKSMSDAMDPQKQQPLMSIGNGTVFDPNKREVVYKGEPQLPGSIQELAYLKDHPDLMSVKERLAAAGRAPTTGEAPFRAATPEELRAYGLPDGATGQVNTRTGKLDVLSKPATLSADKQADVAAKRQKAQQAQQDAVATFNDSIKKIDDLIGSDNFGKLGTFTGDLETHIPHTGAADAKAQLDTIGNQSVINTLSSLKSLSATGASGFGALSEKEGEILRNAAANLATAQSNEALKKNLLELREKLARSRDRVKQQQITLPEDSVSKASSGQQPSKQQATPTDDPLGIL